MTKKKIQPAVFKQLEDALEERKSSDRRRQKEATPPEGVVKDRREGDRRTVKK